MAYLSKWVAQAALVCSAMVVSAGASAQVTWSVADGKVTGAQNINVAGSFYNVVFSDIYVAPQAFATRAFASSASQALVEQVFVPSAPISLDSNPWLLTGCDTACAALTFWNDHTNPTSPNGLTFAANLPSPNEDYAVDAGVSWSLALTNQELSRGSVTLASWSLVASVSAVPEPEAYAMMLVGLGLVGAIARRRKAKQA